MSGLSRTARFALLASLALNVVLAVALVVAAPWSDRRGGESRARHVPPFPALFDPRALKDALTPERRAVLDAALQAHREAMRARLGTLFEARQAVRAAIVADPFDRAALDAAFVHLREAEAETAAQAQTMLGDVLAQAPAEERRRVAQLVELRKWNRRERQRAPDIDVPSNLPSDPPPQKSSD